MSLCVQCEDGVGAGQYSPGSRPLVSLHQLPTVELRGSAFWDLKDANGRKGAQSVSLTAQKTHEYILIWLAQGCPDLLLFTVQF